MPSPAVALAQGARQINSSPIDFLIAHLLRENHRPGPDKRASSALPGGPAISYAPQPPRAAFLWLVQGQKFSLLKSAPVCHCPPRALRPARWRPTVRTISAIPDPAVRFAQDERDTWALD